MILKGIGTDPNTASTLMCECMVKKTTINTLTPLLKTSIQDRQKRFPLPPSPFNMAPKISTMANPEKEGQAYIQYIQGQIVVYSIYKKEIHNV